MVKVLALVCGSVGWKAFLGLISPGTCSQSRIMNISGL